MTPYDQEVATFGDIDVTIEHCDGNPDNIIKTEKYTMKNTILRTGRVALAKILANDYEDTFNFYVNRMIFGDSGTVGGVPKFVNEGRQGLFGLTVLNKPVVASIDPSVPTQAVFTSVITFSEANSLTINEMALQMANGDLYSMRTFPDLNKTSTMQITYNWRISFI